MRGSGRCKGVKGRVKDDVRVKILENDVREDQIICLQKQIVICRPILEL